MAFSIKTKQEDKSKIVSKDIDFVHEMFELCKNLTSLEAHSWSAYVSSIMSKKEDPKELERAKEFRKLRSLYMKDLVSGDGFEVWCRSKHLLESAMRLQESAQRYLMIGEKEKAKQCALDYGKIYLEFLKLNRIIL